MLIHVNHISLKGNNKEPNQSLSIVTTSTRHLHLKSLVELQHFLAIEAFQNSIGLHLSKSKYIIDLRKKIKMNGSKGKSTLASTTTKLSDTDGETFQETTLYRSTIGTLQYLTCTRPKIVFIINKLNQSFNSLPSFTGSSQEGSNIHKGNT